MMGYIEEKHWQEKRFAFLGIPIFFFFGGGSKRSLVWFMAKLSYCHFLDFRVKKLSRKGLWQKNQGSHMAGFGGQKYGVGIALFLKVLPKPYGWL